MKKITAKPLKILSNPMLWTDIEEEASAQISGGRIAIGETRAIDGLGRPVKSSQRLQEEFQAETAKLSGVLFWF
jgi:hypothetical protein